MKIAQNVVDELRDLIEPFDTEDMRENYRLKKFPRAEQTRDVNKRYRWDLYWAATDWHVRDSLGLAGPDISDSHIDTALRKIVPRL